MNKQIYSIAFLLIVLATSCEKNTKSDLVVLNTVESPSTKQSSLPYLFSNENKTLVSWIEREKKSKEKTLLYAELINGKWGTPNEIATGNDWAVNWADFPVIAENNGHVLAHTLKLSSKESFVYDVSLNLFNATDSKWINDIPLNTDGVKAEHGFLTVLPYKDDSFFVTWLDGRHTGGSSHGGEETSGAMSIRAAEVTANGTIINELELDNKTCDCCQTSAAITTNGPVVLYRDRSEDEVRDISIVRLVDGKWTAPETVFSDDWEIKGCPVNGPKAAALNNNLAVTWFTAVHDEPKVKIAFSTNGGEHFNPAINISNTSPIGRVDVAMINDDTAVVSWMESSETGTQLKATKVHSSGKVSEPLTISAEITVEKGGFPQMELVDDSLYFVWTEVINDASTIMTASVLVKNIK